MNSTFVNHLSNFWPDIFSCYLTWVVFFFFHVKLRLLPLLIDRFGLKVVSVWQRICNFNWFFCVWKRQKKKKYGKKLPNMKNKSGNDWNIINIVKSNSCSKLIQRRKKSFGVFFLLVVKFLVRSCMRWWLCCWCCCCYFHSLPLDLIDCVVHWALNN